MAGIVAAPMVASVISVMRRGNGNDSDNNNGNSSDCNSFPTGTLVRMGDGSLRPIDEIEPGEFVLAGDPVTGVFESQEVLAQWSHLDDGVMATAVLVDGSQVTATDHHQFWVPTSSPVPTAGPGEWVNLDDVQPGNFLLTPEGVTQVARVDLALPTETLVWELDTAGSDTFTVHTGTSDVLVHNVCGVGLSIYQMNQAIEANRPGTKGIYKILAGQQGPASANHTSAHLPYAKLEHDGEGSFAVRTNGEIKDAKGKESWKLEDDSWRWLHANGWDKPSWMDAAYWDRIIGNDRPAARSMQVDFDGGYVAGRIDGDVLTVDGVFDQRTNIVGNNPVIDQKLDELVVGMAEFKVLRVEIKDVNQLDDINLAVLDSVDPVVVMDRTVYGRLAQRNGLSGFVIGRETRGNPGEFDYLVGEFGGS